jgi:hypothetical protein
LDERKGKGKARSERKEPKKVTKKLGNIVTKEAKAGGSMERGGIKAKAQNCGSKRVGFRQKP